MVVDDEKDQIFCIEKAFKVNYKDKYEFISINSANDCFNWLENNDLPDLIILDILMPKINGFEIFEKIRSNPKWADIPIIFLSGLSGIEVKNAGEFFADAFIEKPIEIEELKAKIDEIL